MPGPYRVLPILEGLCAAVDELFVEAVGPLGTMLAAEARADWTATGHKTRTHDVADYIARLAREIDDPTQRTAFVSRARALIGPA